MHIPYLETSVSKALKKIIGKPKLVLATHDKTFHADDVFASALLRLFFSLGLPEQKYTITRNPVDSLALEKADMVFDCGRIYDSSKLRFDHHQTGGADTYDNGIKYSSIGLLWKHFGASVCALYVKKISGKDIGKQMAENIAIRVNHKLIRGLDAADNGQDTYKPLFDKTEVFTLSMYVATSVGAVLAGSENTDTATVKALDKKFFKTVSFAEVVLEDVLTTAYYDELYKSKVEKIYSKSKDKRVIVCDQAYKIDYSIFPEALFFVYPHRRGGWGAEVVRKSMDSFEARLPFPKEWGGKEKAELEQISGVKDARFCHNALFLVTAETKKAVLQLVDKALQLAGLKPMIY